MEKPTWKINREKAIEWDSEIIDDVMVLFYRTEEGWFFEIYGVFNVTPGREHTPFVNPNGYNREYASTFAQQYMKALRKSEQEYIENQRRKKGFFGWLFG